MTDQTVCAVVLAAGGGSRFTDQGHKLLAELPATPDRPAERVIDRAIHAAVEASVGPVVVVTGRLTAEEIGLDTDTVDVVHNDRWAHGQATSIQTGLAAAHDLEASIAVVGLADQPGITPDAWAAVADAARNGAAIAVATYDGRRGNPVALSSDVWTLMPVDGDEGARSLMRIRDDLVIAVTCSGQPDDIDTVEDLHRWQSN